MSPLPEKQLKPKIGIITALPEEFAAMKAMLEEGEEYWVEGRGAGLEYWLGEIPAAQKKPHPLVLARAGMGTNIAAIRAEKLLQHFPNVDSILMVGIAGGIPYPQKPEDHVRLGDVVISDRQGVIQYDFIKEGIEKNIHRHSPRPPCAVLLEAMERLQVAELESRYPWLAFIERGLQKLKWKRPSPKTDKSIEHPQDPQRRAGQPRIFTGSIACANTLLKNPAKRDQLRDKFGAKAVEMEASGIADATWHHNIGYLAVRGICDYCDQHKNDIWHKYAAIVAAAYASALIATMPGAVAVSEHAPKGTEKDRRNGEKIISPKTESSEKVIFSSFQRERLEREHSDLQASWQRHNKLLSALREQYHRETRVEEKFRLEAKIKQVETECQKVEKQLQKLEAKLI
ncbi:MAG: hypothetical protein GY862_34785 [Gammaproteobacteria bacterium]|nr:hypothetical protein [Gammaproteobacteria bacterium]